MPAALQYIAKHWMELLVGIGFIASYGHTRFNTPPTNRCSTTRLRYTISALLYIVALIILYVAALTLASLLKPVIELLNLPPQISNLSPPLLFALVITVLLPRFKLVSDWDIAIRGTCWWIGAIPAAHVQLTRCLINGRFEISAEAHAAIRSQFANDDPLAQWLDAPAAVRVATVSTWLRCAALIHQISCFEKDESWAGFVAAFRDRWEQVQRDVNDLANAARVAMMPPRDLNTFKERAELIERSVCEFFASGLLYCYPKPEDRQVAARAAGITYNTSDAWPNPVAQPLLAVAMGVFVLTLVVYVTYRKDYEVGKAIVKALRIASLFSVSAFIAVFPRQYYGAGQPRAGHRRIGYCILVGLLAIIVAWPVLALADLAVFPFDQAVKHLHRNNPWLTFAFVTAFTTAFFLDNEDTVTLRGKELPTRIFESLGQGILTIGASLLTYRWLSREHDPHLGQMLIICPIVGLLIGAVVPAAFRSGQEESRRPATPRDPGPGPVPEASHGNAASERSAETGPHIDEDLEPVGTA